ncbi:protein containing SET domain protein [Pyrenophora tritici-repentis]|uniref:Protein containing SET domain protein n=1 Tax=Pyrenophora tritici-repentis TaxID=45151 RepID=A0A2W1DXX3_9PLEO|nr:protein containing SET domain protein [Pyrenophora tritici-repentis]KAF7447877.1 protein containing SET domain protein [Pyrenophora tritici-repentis]KAF7571577.1 protein containing SET domain protein [Pyrenophora tritici-repentis]KAG9385197.1 protein containing SET domain protein [Pyrenophora tritici-repentis]KAI0583961.1 protein containing SET domain protein [Pyrenophora tritici-repentis]
MHIPPDHADIQLQRCPDLVIKSDTPKGRGVFATNNILAGTIIDICPVLVLGTEENKEHIEKTSLYHYTYNWPIKDMNGNNQTAQAVIFGLGSMFNHSTQEQNVGWMRDLGRQIITYRALRDIRRGEELCISYGSHLTFKDADPVPPTPPEEELEQLRMMEPY